MPYFSIFLCHIFAKESYFIRKKYVSSINPKITFMISGDKPILTLKISVTKF